MERYYSKKEIDMATNRTNETILMAAFSTPNNAEQAVEALHDANFTSDQIRYSGQYKENFLQAVKALQIFPDEAQDESLNDIMTMLQNMGIAQDAIQYYMDAYNNGQPVVIVRPDARPQDAATILQQNGGNGYSNH